MSIATLRNLAASENDDVLTEMLTVGLDRVLETMIQSGAHKQTGNANPISDSFVLSFFLFIYFRFLITICVGDIELESDVKFLHDVLVKNYKELSTFDKWASEVHSGALR